MNALLRSVMVLSNGLTVSLKVNFCVPSLPGRLAAHRLGQILDRPMAHVLKWSIAIIKLIRSTEITDRFVHCGRIDPRIVDLGTSWR
jgi:hypothetical protein